MLGIAIDPTKDIFGFGHFNNKLLFKYNRDNSIFELHFISPILDGWYPCEQIFITFKSNPRERLCLDDVAFSWVKGDINFSKFTISSFESKDLLEQLCISFLIKRLQKEYGQSTETNKPEGFLAQYLRKREVENKFILNKFLEILKPKIDLSSKNFAGDYNTDYGEVLGKALTFTSVTITGELKKIVDEQINLYKNNPDNKKLLRAYNRSYRITPWKTFERNHPFYPQKGNKSRTDIKNIADASCRIFIESLMQMSKANNSANMLAPVMMEIFSKDRNLSELTTLTINCNSERIYKPNSKYSLIGFIFGHKQGKPSRIVSYLKDTTLRKKSEVQFNEWDNINEISNNENQKTSFQNKRYWKNHSKWMNIPKEKKDTLLEKLNFLPKKQLYAVSKYMDGYGSLNQNERQNLTKARKKIKEKGLNMEV